MDNFSLPECRVGKTCAVVYHPSSISTREIQVAVCKISENLTVSSLESAVAHFSTVYILPHFSGTASCSSTRVSPIETALLKQTNKNEQMSSILM